MHPVGTVPVQAEQPLLLLAGCSAQGWAWLVLHKQEWGRASRLVFAGQRLPAGWGDALGARRGWHRWDSGSTALPAAAAVRPGRAGGLQGGFGLPAGLGLGGETLRLGGIACPVWEMR